MEGQGWVPLAELAPNPIDDNLTVPAVSGVVMWVMV